MHALIITEQKFWGKEQLDQFVKDFGQYGHPAGFVGMMIDPPNFTARILYYQPLNPADLDIMFQEQMAAEDSLLAMPGSGKKLGTNQVGYSTTSAVGMTDSDQPEEY